MLEMLDIWVYRYEDGYGVLIRKGSKYYRDFEYSEYAYTDLKKLVKEKFGIKMPFKKDLYWEKDEDGEWVGSYRCEIK